MALPTLGSRGEGWLALQSLLAAAVGLSALVDIRWSEGIATPLLVVGVALGAVGLALIAVGPLLLGDSFTPLPRPRGSAVSARGPYRVVRHPMYSGMFLLALGWSLGTGPIGLILTAAFALVLDLKARREEAWLCERYSDYADYRRRVRWRFLPGIR